MQKIQLFISIDLTKHSTSIFKEKIKIGEIEYLARIAILSYLFCLFVWHLPSTGLLPKWMQWLEPSWSEAGIGGSFWVSHLHGRGPNTGPFPTVLPGALVGGFIGSGTSTSMGGDASIADSGLTQHVMVPDLNTPLVIIEKHRECEKEIQDLNYPSKANRFKAYMYIKHFA